MNKTKREAVFSNKAILSDIEKKNSKKNKEIDYQTKTLHSSCQIHFCIRSNFDQNSHFRYIVFERPRTKLQLSVV